MSKAFLVLDDGAIFEGESWAALGETFGEAVFSTGMTGYQETLTDPSYHKQVVIMTAPHIGNTGMNSRDEESSRIWVAGFVVRNPSPRVSNWRSELSLEEALIDSGVIGIKGVDTRAITRHLRDRGAMRVGLFSGVELSREEMVIRVRKSPQMTGAALASDVSTTTPYIVAPPAGVETKFTVAAIDLGIKAATPRQMAARGIEVHVFPMSASIEEIGFETYKLPFGHRGINQPVKNLRTGQVEITAHNHGFAVAAPVEGNFTTVYGAGFVSHICLNDGVVEGLELLETPAFSVQYHPEAAAGPHDANYLFDQFVGLMNREKSNA